MRSDEEAPEYGDALGREWHESADHILICEGRFRGEAEMHGRVADRLGSGWLQAAIGWSIEPTSSRSKRPVTRMAETRKGLRGSAPGWRCASPGLAPIPPAGRRGPHRSASPSLSDAASRSPTPSVRGRLWRRRGQPAPCRSSWARRPCCPDRPRTVWPRSFPSRWAWWFESRIVERVGLCEPAKVIEYDRGGDT